MAHDGSDWGTMVEAAHTARTAQSVLVARCLAAQCGVESALDVAELMEVGREFSLRAFEARLRCACGARRLRVEPATGEPPPRNPAIYLFR